MPGAPLVAFRECTTRWGKALLAAYPLPAAVRSDRTARSNGRPTPAVQIDRDLRKLEGKIKEVLIRYAPPFVASLPLLPSLSGARPCKACQ
mmetsp:Transcript_20854/g.50865  ORF Transcript_20854/g.50865 Transcript_20854/m.50865 type:complete len:91 (+) Transcript_20854:362-634(+)